MQGPINPATRMRGNEAVEIKDDLNALWGKRWIKGYAVVFGLLGTMYLINHAFDWVGMIANTFIFMVYSIILAPVLTAPSLTGAVTIAGLFGRDVPQAFKTYLGGIAPNIAFWSLLAVGAMAWFPWHLGALWAGPLVMAISLFLVVHTWKYASEAKIIKTLSLWYAIGVLLVGLGFALGLNKPIDNLINWVNPPAPYTATGTTRMMNSVNGERFLGEPQPGCRAAGNCYDPNHGTNGKGTPVVVWDSERAKELQDKVRDQSKKPDPAPKPDSSVLLTEQHFLTRGACGSFHIITIAEGEMVGPIGAFKGQPIDYSFVDGSGTPEYYTLSADQVKANQSDTNQVKVKPVQATKLRNGRFQTNHIGPTGHMFFSAKGGPVMISLERSGCT